MSDPKSETGRFIDSEQLEEHDPKHPKIKPHSPIVILVIVGAIALLAAMSIMFIMQAGVTM